MVSLRQLQVFRILYTLQNLFRLFLTTLLMGTVIGSLSLSLPAVADSELPQAPQNFLYRVVLPLTISSDETEPPKAAFDQLVSQGMKKLLLRLTGSRQALSSEAYKPFLQHPKKWLSAYYYRPRLEEGVTVGQELVLQFDRQRLLRAFQQSGIIIWPLNKRPAILVLGRYQVADVSVLLDVAGLSQHLNVDFRPIAQSLGLPVVPFVEEPPAVGQSIVAWGETPEASLELSQWASQYEVPAILLFDLLRTDDGYQIRYLSWQKQTSTNEGEALLETNELEGTNLPSLYEEMFMAVAEHFSEAYRAEASVLGEVSLVVHKPPSAQSIFELENRLQALKPTLHEVKLQQVSRERLVFDLTYQGSFEGMVKALQQSSPLILTKVDALTGQLQAQWQMSEHTRETTLELQNQLEQEMLNRLQQEAVPIESAP